MSPSHKLRGFTLIELLVCIAIIAILAALAFTGSRSVMSRVNDSKCVAQLKQIGLAIHGFAADNDGCLPRSNFVAPRDGSTARYPSSTWQHIVQLYSQPGTDARFWERSKFVNLFICPSRTVKTDPSRTDIGWTYAAHAGLMPDQVQDPFYMWKLVSISRPSELVLIADALQTPGPNASSHSTFFGITGPSGGWTAPGSPANANLPMSDGPDRDGLNQANFRFRHGGRMNALFVDGHVASLPKGGVLERNFRFLNY